MSHQQSEIIVLADEQVARIVNNGWIDDGVLLYLRQVQNGQKNLFPLQKRWLLDYRIEVRAKNVNELKVNSTAKEALEQIDDRGYAIPYKTDGRSVVKIGVRFNADTRVPEEWVIE